MTRPAVVEADRLEVLLEGLLQWQPLLQRTLGDLRVALAEGEAQDVFESAAGVIGPAGGWGREFPTEFRSIHVANLAADTLTVSTNGHELVAPSVGAGVARVPGGVARTINLRGNTIHVYGTPGDAFDITVYRRLRPAGYGGGGGSGPASAAATGTITIPNVTNVSTPVLAANPDRKGVLITNEGPSPALLAYSAAASVAAYTVAIPVGYWEMPSLFTGPLAAITGGGNAQLRVTELT